jgi:hypothetical protein
VVHVEERSFTAEYVVRHMKFSIASNISDFHKFRKNPISLLITERNV